MSPGGVNEDDGEGYAHSQMSHRGE
jgi:hypothetical protein